MDDPAVFAQTDNSKSCCNCFETCWAFLVGLYALTTLQSWVMMFLYSPTLQNRCSGNSTDEETSSGMFSPPSSPQVEDIESPQASEAAASVAGPSGAPDNAGRQNEGNRNLFLVFFRWIRRDPDPRRTSSGYGTQSSATPATSPLSPDADPDRRARVRLSAGKVERSENIPLMDRSSARAGSSRVLPVPVPKLDITETSFVE